MSGAGDGVLQTLGRLKESKMIRRYTHLTERHLREAVEKIANNSPTISATAVDEVEAAELTNINQINRVGR
jgi:hypothetical protein